MITLESFKETLNVKTIKLTQFTKGKRYFATLKVGEISFDIYLKEDTDIKKPLYVTENEKGFFIHNAKEALGTIEV
jgi:hypothetical protein